MGHSYSINSCWAGESNHRPIERRTAPRIYFQSTYCSMSLSMKLEYSYDSLSKANRVRRNVCAYFSFCLQRTWPKSRSVIWLAWERMCHTANHSHEVDSDDEEYMLLLGSRCPEEDAARERKRKMAKSHAMPKQTNKPKVFFFSSLFCETLVI